MTLEQAQRTPGYYGRLIEPWTPESDGPLLFRVCGSPHGRNHHADPSPWATQGPSARARISTTTGKPMEPSLMLCGPAGFLTSVFILAGVPIHEAMYRAVEMLKRADTSVS